MTARTVVFNAIGQVHSPFTTAMGTPVQPYAAAVHQGGAPTWDSSRDATKPVLDVRGGCGSLQIIPEWSEALQDLDGFSHIWVLFLCHKGNAPTPLVTPYRDTIARGLFSTRVPARPNPIGMSCVRIRAVHAPWVHVCEMDILDGTPILDIKPYVPEYDHRENPTRGWLESPTATQGIMHADLRFYKEQNL